MAARATRAVGLGMLGLPVVGATARGGGVLFFACPGGPRARGVLGLILAASAPLGRSTLALGARARAPALVSGWWATPPSNDRNWQPEVAVLPHATVSGDLVTVHNVRNFDVTASPPRMRPKRRAPALGL